MRLIRKYGKYGPRLFEEVWNLLRMYTFIVNAELKQRGLPPKGQLELMGAICSHFLLAMQPRIIDDYKAAVVGRAVDHYKSYLPTAAGGATPSTVSDVLGAGGVGSPGAGYPEDEEADGPLRWHPRGPDPLGLRLPKESREVRGRGERTSRAVDAREQIRRALDDE